MRDNKAVNSDAPVRPLPAVAPGPGRRLPLRYPSQPTLSLNLTQPGG
jgi:hypothetical protein